jgi:hypothetical protein
MFQLKNRRHKMLAAAPLICVAMTSAAAAGAEATRAPLFLTATNGANNYLAIINTQTKQATYVPTGGAGGVSSGSNGGGVAVSGETAAVINFGSSNVTIFVRQGNSMQPTQVIKTASQPVSVAFGHGHLVVLELATTESFPVYGTNVATSADGAVPLLVNDKTAGQIISYDGGVAYTQTSGVVAAQSLSTDGMAGLSGPNVAVSLPAFPNNNTPLGLIGRGANIYLTIAHSDLQALVVNGQIVSMAAGPTPFVNQAGALTHAPCWNALAGQFLYSSDSPGGQIVRYLVSDSHIFLDKSGAATLGGAPTDLAADGSLLGVIDGGSGGNSDVSLFDIDSEGELALRFTLKIPSPINGAAIIR